MPPSGQLADPDEIMNFSSGKGRYMQVALARGVVIWIIVAGQLCLNVHLGAQPESFCTSHVVQPVINGFVWVSWNTLLCLLAIESHSINLLESKDRSDGIVKDRPFRYHWPKLFVWIPNTGTLHPRQGCSVRVISSGHAAETAWWTSVIRFSTAFTPRCPKPCVPAAHASP